VRRPDPDVCGRGRGHARNRPSGLTIHAVLGGRHTSPYAGQTVSAVPGVVTDVTSNFAFPSAP